MELDPAPMRFFDPHLQWIVEGLWRLALLSRQILGPRLQLRGIESVGARANLEHEGVEVQLLRAIDDADDLRLLLLDRQSLSARPVDVGDRRDPRCAKL